MIYTMKVKKSRITIYRYELNDGFYAEINFDKKRKYYECYLGHERVGIKDYMFGLPEYQECEDKHYDLSDIEEIVFDNIAYDNYVDYYIERYMEDWVIPKLHIFYELKCNRKKK